MPTPAPTPPPARPGDPIDLAQSVAGEEDPGASIDLAVVRKDETAPKASGTPGQPPGPKPG